MGIFLALLSRPGEQRTLTMRDDNTHAHIRVR